MLTKVDTNIHINVRVTACVLWEADSEMETSVQDAY